MNRFLHISFHLQRGPSQGSRIGAAFPHPTPNWVRYAFNCWIVWTPRPATDFLYVLKPAIGNSDSILIVRLDLTDRSGWEPMWIWDWMDKRDNSGRRRRPLHHLLTMRAYYLSCLQTARSVPLAAAAVFLATSVRLTKAESSAERLCRSICCHAPTGRALSASAADNPNRHGSGHARRCADNCWW